MQSLVHLLWWPRRAMSDQQKKVKVGDVVDVTFRGSPPYNVTRR
jgi:hypothetical protein